MGLDLELVARLADIGQIDRQHVSTVDVLDILPAALGLMLLSDAVMHLSERNGGHPRVTGLPAPSGSSDHAAEIAADEMGILIR